MHTEKSEKYHEKTITEKYHSGNIDYKHNGKIINKKIEIGAYHMNTKTETIQKCRCGSTNIKRMTVSIEGWFGWRSKCRASCGRDVDSGETIYHCPSCCDRSSSHIQSTNSDFWTCNGYFCKNCMEKNWERREYCSKCKQSPITKGCNIEYRHDEYWSCCNHDVNSEGCKEYCSNCNGLYKNIGCKERYLCCKKLINSEGCQEKYKCCKSDIRHNNATGCKYKWQCCNQIVQNNNEGKCCQQLCKICEQPWGSQPGCTMKIQHEFV